MIYAITIYGEAGVFEALPQDRQDEVMSGHGALQDALKKKGKFVSMKLMPPTSAVMVEPATGAGAAPIITDGPFAATKMISSPVARLEVRPVAWAGGAISSE